MASSPTWAGDKEAASICRGSFCKKNRAGWARVCAVMEDSRRSDNGHGPMRHKRTIIHSAAEDKLASNFFINVGAAEMYSDAGHGSKIFNRLLFTSAG